jgi:5-methylcytosine-specific restriction endonuclease McrA
MSLNPSPSGAGLWGPNPRIARGAPLSERLPDSEALSALGYHPGMAQLHRFVDTGPTLTSAWRGIVLLGRNVQSYKFALGKTLLDLAKGNQAEFGLDELALPFTTHLLEHLEKADKQGTPASSKFLDSCRAFLRGDLGEDELHAVAVSLGFNNVLDAFHTVGRDPVGIRFFTVSGTGTRRRVSLTDSLFEIASGKQRANLPDEVEARWQLVEAAWELGLETRALAGHIAIEREGGVLEVQTPTRRVPLAGARVTVGAYQKGTCFYCAQEIGVPGEMAVRGDVDHFIPWSLGGTVYGGALNLDGVWNLVVSCRECNRGAGGKMAQLPSVRMLQHLHARNEFYILSHHPLREALIAQTGNSGSARAGFLQRVWSDARSHGIQVWEPQQRAEAVY